MLSGGIGEPLVLYSSLDKQIIMYVNFRLKQEKEKDRRKKLENQENWSLLSAVY